jgi:hypothetical protein
MAHLLRPEDLKRIASDSELEKMQDENREKREKEEMALELRETFMARGVQPEAIERINAAIRIAAERGHHQLQVMTFPCSYCIDGGRRINIGDPEWPGTLQGFAKKGYEFFEQELRPLGFKLGAEIISFPGGMPGEVGLFLRW